MSDHAQRAHPGPVIPPRTRLLSRLSGPERLVVVHGPRWSGKTTVLRQWLSADSSSAGTTAGTIEPDPGLTGDRYWQVVVNSLRSKQGPGDRAVQRIESVPGPSDSFGDHYREVRDLIRTWPGPLTLILDDLHLVGDPETHVRDLLQQAPPAGFRVLATTRIAMRWHRSSGVPADSVLVTPADLLLTDSELSAVVELAGVTTLNRVPLGLIAAETGRVAGLVGVGVNALATASSSRGDPTGRIRTEIDRVVVRVLTGDPELVSYRDDVFRTAAAAPLTSSAATVVIDEVGEGEATVVDRLDAVERHGLTVRDLEKSEPTWSYPDPVRGSILRLAATESPHVLRDARLALSDYWLRQGRPHAAFVHAIDAESWDRVLEILRDNWRTLYTTNFLQMDGDLRRIPADVLEGEPLFDTLRRMHSQFSAPKDSPAPAPDIVTSSDEPDNAERLMRMLSRRMDGRFEAAASEYGPLSRIPVPDPESSTQAERDGPAFVFLHLGLSLLLVGRIDDANQMLRRAHRLGAGTFVERDAAGKLTLAHAVLGHLADADSWWDEERRHPQLPPDSELVVRPAGMIGAALARLDRLDVDSAIGLITDLGAPADREELWGFALYVYGQIALTTGTAADGLRYVDHHMKRYPGLCDHGAVVGPLLDAVRADLHLALGRSDLSAELVGDSSHPLTATVRARTRLFDGDNQGALEIVRRYYGDLRCTQRDSVELSLVGAAASIGISAREEAVQYLERAVTKSTLTGLVRPFTTLPRGTMARLARLGPELPVAAHGTDTGVPSSPHAATEVTEREHAILRSLETGDSITAIADRHYVSVNTVKTQLRSVYRKLGARSRSAAVDEARRLGLL
ncbi:MAG: LuxR C-terminal-related transcriptional regulator [Dietzia sp.]